MAARVFRCGGSHLADCYLCGAWISRGMGYRRQVQTGSSTRTYITRRGGASFSTSHGLRTLCGDCAEIHDRTSAVNFGDAILPCGGWVLSALAGWFIAGSESGWAKLIGLSFMLGLPVFLAHALVRRERHKAVAREVRERSLQPAPQPEPAPSARRPTETGTEWLRRVLPPEFHAHREFWEASVRKHPPRAGVTFLEWGDEVTSASVEPLTQPDLAEAAFSDGDTIQSWAVRAAEITAVLSGADRGELERTCLQLAHYFRPHTGEGIKEYISRATARLKSVDHSLDPRSPASARRADETLREWLDRTAYLCLTAPDEDCLEDIVERLTAVGQFTPPEKDESIAAWLDRTLPLLGD